MACQHVSTHHSPALFLTRIHLNKTDFLLLQTCFPPATLQNVYIKELLDQSSALQYILQDLAQARDLPGLILLYTPLDPEGCEVISTLQHLLSLQKIAAVCGCPEDKEGIKLTAGRYFARIEENKDAPQTT